MLSSWAARPAAHAPGAPVLPVLPQVLTLERTLPFDVRPEYLPEILPQTGTVYDVGIEGLTFKFPFAYYGGHHYEDGYNCIQLWEVSEREGDEGRWVRPSKVAANDCLPSCM